MHARAVSLQNKGAHEHPVAYISCLWTSAERNYSAYERKAVAMMWAFNTFRSYIDDLQGTGAPLGRMGKRNVVTDMLPRLPYLYEKIRSRLEETIKRTRTRENYFRF